MITGLFKYAARTRRGVIIGGDEPEEVVYVNDTGLLPYSTLSSCLPIETQAVDT
jgi:hypothetical protein